MNKKENTIIAILLIISLMIISIGLGYAFFSYTKQGLTENVIETGNIKFHYNEQMGKGRGINITDALPLSDNEGKSLTGNGKYFDFEITSSTTSNVEIPYVVTARVNPTSTLAPGLIKIYVTDQNDNVIEDVRYFDEPSNSTGKTWLEQYSGVSIDKYVEKVVYVGTVPSDSSNYRKDFRIRIWIDGSVEFDDLNNDKTFNITFNVYATGQEKAATPNYTIVSGDLDTLGSEVCIDEECFYVLGKQDSTHVILFAKYNLYHGNGFDNSLIKQRQGNNQTISFIDDDSHISDLFWASNDEYPYVTVNVYDDQSNLYPIMQQYTENLRQKGVSVTSRLMLDSDYILAGVDYVSDEWVDIPRTAPTWLYSTAYWTGIGAWDNCVSGVYSSQIHNENYGSIDDEYGIRPVIILEV